MIKRIDGPCYKEFLFSGIKNLEIHRGILNDLNVFPVPDGDTGTNMVMTLRYGYDTVKEQSGTLSEISDKFSSSAVFGARGNSGVIVSQFFKGLSSAFANSESADPELFAFALQSGCGHAYASVSKPVEGTMLTVIREAAKAVSESLPLPCVEAAVDIFLKTARVSLANTPNLLPILKKANVVDSGASGIVYFFEGVRKYLNGEPIEETEDTVAETHIDLSLFNRHTRFDYGYCVEGLLQLKIETSDFDHERFNNKLSEYGDSAVSSLEGDKVKLHVHVKKLAPLMEYIQKLGELLTVKIENMTVQNVSKEGAPRDEQKFLYSTEREPGSFAVVAVAPNSYMQQCFFDMGADVVILSEIAPSSQEFMDAFKLTASKKILVFPNSANSILSSMQAGSLYKNAQVRVLNCRSVPECYSVLSVMDFEQDVSDAVESANSILADTYQYSVYRAVKDVNYESKSIRRNEFFALSGKTLLNVRDTLEDAVLDTADKALKERGADIVTVYYGKDISPDYIELLTEKLEALGDGVEVVAVSTFETSYDITVTLE